MLSKKGIVNGEILAAKIDPEKLYPVNYTIDFEGNKHFGKTEIKGRFLTENQIIELSENESQTAGEK